MIRRFLSLWVIAPLLVALVAIYFGRELLREHTKAFLPGKTTDGHHQIEIACGACHTPFQGVRQESCLGCHGEELAQAADSHGMSKFGDPRTYSMLAAIDATRCVTCHTEHEPARTGRIGVTVPRDFCYSCHADIAKDRPSHQDLAFDTCAGCHNYHDNRDLYEDFLAKHLDEPALLASPLVPTRDYARFHAESRAEPPRPLGPRDHDGIMGVAADPAVVAQWAAGAHATSGINCSDCHRPRGSNGEALTWTDHPGTEPCGKCHDLEAQGFLQSRHGMRLAADLPPMTPAQARLPMKLEDPDKPLNCMTCHPVHAFDTQRAATEICEGCHDDTHTRAYPGSPHHRLWQAELAGETVPGSGVSCATCHFPRVPTEQNGKKRILVVHNQNAHLRPSSKMIRSVCLQCHGLGMTLDSLADPALKANNYATPPAEHIKTLDMVFERLNRD